MSFFNSLVASGANSIQVAELSKPAVRQCLELNDSFSGNYWNNIEYWMFNCKSKEGRLTAQYSHITKIIGQANANYEKTRVKYRGKCL